MVEVWAASRHRPQGILICDDMLFSDASKAILALQIRVPEDLLVVTHANKGSDVWAPFPALKLEFDPDEYARTQVELFLSERQRQPGRPSQRIVLPFRQAHQTDQYLDRVEHYAAKITEG
jgi:DNA-binding LacI/PurR family transcriptional regulator